MSEFARVKDPKTGHTFSMAAAAVPEGYTVLKQDATDAGGRPLPPEYATKSSTASKEK